MNRIKEVLFEQGLTQVWLSETLNKSFNVINRYCTNKQQPRLEVLYEIARFLEVDICELIISSEEYEN